MSMKKPIAIVIILFIISFLPTSQAAFADSFSFTISPSVTTIHITQPGTIETPLILQNKGSNAQTLTILFKAFTFSNKQDGIVQYQASALSQKEKNFFQHVALFENNKAVSVVTVAPHQAKSLMLHLSVDNLIQEDHYFSIIFKEDRQINPKTISSQIQGAIASNILVSTGADQKPKAEVNTFTSPFFIEKGPVPFSIKVKNTGVHFVSTHGYITITNLFGQTIGKVDLAPVNILANTARLIPGQSTHATPNLSTTQEFPQSIALWPENVLLGPYTATLHLSLSSNGPILTSTHTFFALPINALLIIIIIILFFLLVQKRVKKYLNS